VPPIAIFWRIFGSGPLCGCFTAYAPQGSLL
jgi:hypothetical protein